MVRVFLAMSHFVPKTSNQEKYMKALKNKSKPIVIAIGPAGTGKTFLSCQEGAYQLIQNERRNMVLTRPAKSVDEEYGYLPGDINKKLAPWLEPIYDSFKKSDTSSELLYKAKLKNKIEIAPFAYMRGRTFDNSWIIADEMQNATHAQTKMLLTRIGENSKLVLTGDLNQCDIQNSGLREFIKKLNCYGMSKYIEIIELDQTDVLRSPAVQEILEIYED